MAVVTPLCVHPGKAQYCVGVSLRSQIGGKETAKHLGRIPEDQIPFPVQPRATSEMDRVRRAGRGVRVGPLLPEADTRVVPKTVSAHRRPGLRLGDQVSRCVRGKTDLIVVLETSPNPREIDKDGDAEGFEFLAGPNATELYNLGGVEDASGGDHALSCERSFSVGGFRLALIALGSALYSDLPFMHSTPIAFLPPGLVK